MSRTDRWTIVLACGSEETRARYHATYEEAVRVMFMRRDPWVPSWQETIKERIHYLPWDETAPWWIAEDPQMAWDHCPDGGAMLWLLASPDLFLFTSERQRLARWVLDELGRDPFGVEERALYDALPHYEDDGVRRCVADLLRKTPDDHTTREPFARWARRRMLLVPFLALYGQTRRLYEVAWLGEQLGFWGPSKLANRLRDLFPAERFTQTFNDKERAMPRIAQGAEAPQRKD